MNNSRTFSGSGPNPITISDINAWFSIFRIHSIEMRQTIMELIQILDSKQLGSMYERINRTLKRK